MAIFAPGMLQVEYAGAAAVVLFPCHKISTSTCGHPPATSSTIFDTRKERGKKEGNSRLDVDGQILVYLQGNVSVAVQRLPFR